MIRIFRSLWRGLLGRCPVCGGSWLFKGYYALRSECPTCGSVFERTGVQSTGAMAINLVFTLFLGFAGGIMLVLNQTDPLWQGLGLLIIGLILFHVVFYRFAKGLWLGIMALTGDMEHDG